MRIIFLGTPQFAVPVLEALISEHDVIAVISQPDREKDKKGNLLPTPVKLCAESHGIKCLQYEKLSEHVGELALLAPDVMITAAYGQLLTRKVLSVPPLGVLNVHASLLPKYRGSSPIQCAVLAGETETGITIMKTDIGMDTGDILSVEKVAIEPSDTYGTLSDKLSAVGARLLTATLEKYGKGEIIPVPQDNSAATHCKKIAKKDGLIDWSASSHEIVCKIRAYNPWPIAYTYFDGMPLKIYSAAESDEKTGECGLVSVRDDSVAVSCGKGSVIIESLQLPGKKVLGAAEFVRGRRNFDGSLLKNE